MNTSNGEAINQEAQDDQLENLKRVKANNLYYFHLVLSDLAKHSNFKLVLLCWCV